MFLARIVFFRLHESPRYLVHAGRPLEAIESLQLISRFNGSNLSLDIGDVDDHQQPITASPTVDTLRAPIPRPNYKKHEQRPRPTSTTTFNASGSESDPYHIPSTSPTSANGTGRATLVTQYSSTDASPNSLDGHSYMTPPVDSHHPVFLEAVPVPDVDDEGSKESSPVKASMSTSQARAPQLRPSLSNRNSRRLSSASARRTSSIYEQKVCGSLPRWLRKPLWAWWDRVMMVLSPEWLRTTVFMWAVWFSMSFGTFLVYTFNSFRLI